MNPEHDCALYRHWSILRWWRPVVPAALIALALSGCVANPAAFYSGMASGYSGYAPRAYVAPPQTCSATRYTPDGPTWTHCY